DGAVGGDAYRRVGVARQAVGDAADRPVLAVVGGDDHRLVGGAPLVGQVDGAVGRHLDVAVQAAALGGVDGHAGPEGEAAVEAHGAARLDVGLRAVVDGVGVDVGGAAGERRREGAAAEGLVVDHGADAAALTGDP